MARGDDASHGSSFSRRHFLSWVAAAAGGALASQAKSARAADDGPKKPNFLILMNDEERFWNMTEFLVPPALRGDERNPAAGTFYSVLTGRRRLRRYGVRFSNYYTTTAPCSPARGVFYTGHHAPDNQLVDNLDFPIQQSLRAEIPTLADVLSAAGYYCAYKGKVHLAKDNELQTTQQMLQRYGFHDWEGPNQMADVDGPAAGADHDEGIATSAARWLGRVGKKQTRRGKPWLLAVNFVNPHDARLADSDGQGAIQLRQGPTDEQAAQYPGAQPFPLAPVPARHPYFYWWNPGKPPNFPGRHGYTIDSAGPRPQMMDELASLLSAVFGNVPTDDAATTTIAVYIDNANPAAGTTQITVPVWQACLNYYLNCIADNDHALNRVLDALVAQGFRNETIILYTADHGDMMLSHMGQSRYFDAAGTTDFESPGEGPNVVMPLRQTGPLAYEENLNVPFVVATLANRRDALVNTFVPKRDVDVRALASSVDVLPTLVEWSGQRRAWYTRKFGRTLSDLGLRTALAGVSLVRVLKTPTHYQLAQWSDGRGGRQYVLFTYDAGTTLDAHYAYLAAWGQCADQRIDTTKRGLLRGLYDGRYKLVRYFSPEDYQLNGETFASLDYATLIAAGTNGQDLQLFDRTTDRYETVNLASSSALIAQLNLKLYRAMVAELRTTTRVPDTIQQVVTGMAGGCQYHAGY